VLGNRTRGDSTAGICSTRFAPEYVVSWIAGPDTDRMELRHIRYFVAVAEEQHFTRAAQRIGIEQSPLSRSIQSLERDLGVRLLERSTRGSKLTSAGEVFLQHARTIIASADRARRAAQATAEVQLESP
jgi:DNA-binding transcriptional LysR family regulator